MPIIPAHDVPNRPIIRNGDGHIDVLFSVDLPCLLSCLAGVCCFIFHGLQNPIPLYFVNQHSEKKRKKSELVLF